MSNTPAFSAPAPNASPGLARPDDEQDEHSVVLRSPMQRPKVGYRLEQLFLEWALGARFPTDWDGAVRSLALTLRGLQATGLIERRTIRRPDHPTHHGFVLTKLGHEALYALSGEWITCP
jgi:hypothetical protein